MPRFINLKKAFYQLKLVGGQYAIYKPPLSTTNSCGAPNGIFPTEHFSIRIGICKGEYSFMEYQLASYCQYVFKWDGIC